ncbi:MAG: DUF4003 family protein [Planctomycetota bacterium]|jgi:hypothetical protein
MTPTPYLPDDPLARFRNMYEALNAERRWWREASPLRFAGMAALTCPGTPQAVATAIRRISSNIGSESGWVGRLDPRLRFIVATMLLARGDKARGFLKEVKRVRGMFRAAGLRRAAVYETMAILILRMHAQRAPITETKIRRFHAIYDEMKRHHWWLTGPDDFPACAILTGQKESPTHIGQAIEDIYQSLRAHGFSRGDPLQTAANILYLSRLNPREAARRYRSLAEGFRNNRVAIWQSDYDELAILTFLNHPAKRVVDHVLKNREAMKTLRPKPDRSLTFNLAASITFLELVRVDRNLKVITDVKALLDMQAIINAQQAAAAAAGASAAAASASSS